MGADWGKAFQVAWIGFSVVFVGLIVLEISVNVIARIIRIFERLSAAKK